MNFKLWNIGYAFLIWLIMIPLGFAVLYAVGTLAFMLALILGAVLLVGGVTLSWVMGIFWFLLMFTLHVLTASLYGKKLKRPESSFWRQFPFAAPVIVFFAILFFQVITASDAEFLSLFTLNGLPWLVYMLHPLLCGFIVWTVGRDKHPTVPFSKILPIITAVVVVATLAVHFVRSYL